MLSCAVSPASTEVRWLDEQGEVRIEKAEPEIKKTVRGKRGAEGR